MKKISLILALLLIFSLFVACNKTDDTPEVTTTAATTTVATTTVATTTALPEPDDGITIGITQKQVQEMLDNSHGYVTIGGAPFFESYGFFKDSNGYNVMLEFDEEDKVIAIKRIPAPIVTEELLNSLPDKISLQTAFEKLGIPTAIGSLATGSGIVRWFVSYIYEDGSSKLASIGANSEKELIVSIRES